MLSKRILLIGNIATALLIGLGVQAQEMQEGRVVSATGRVSINGSPVKIRDKVPAGARIETAPSAAASILFGRESVMNLNSNTSVYVDSISGNAVNATLERGSVDGVKRTGGSGDEIILVRTEVGVFKVSEGRYSASTDSEGTQGTFVAVDGGGEFVYSAGAGVGSDGLETEQSIVLEGGGVVRITSSDGETHGTGVVGGIHEGGGRAVEKSIVAEGDAQNLRGSVRGQPTAEERLHQVVRAIENPSASMTQTESASRGIASLPGGGTGGSAASPSGGEPRFGGGLGGITPGAGFGGQIPRDPLQPLPGANAQVKVIFEP